MESCFPNTLSLILNGMKTHLTWKAEDVMHAVHGHNLHEQTWKAHGVSIDSRTVQKGDLFVALKGPEHDGHDHVAAAFTNGAIAAIVAHQPPQVSAQAPLITVEDTFIALEELGHAGRARAEAKIIAVTGSVGKTGTKDMLRLMLNATGSAYASEGSLNNHWGVPLSLARLPADAHYGVFEMGMNHAGELGPLSRQAQPHVALITTIEAAHLEHFPSIHAIADAKAEIFLGVKPGGTAVLNRDNLQFARLASAAKAAGIKKILGFGHDGKCDARLLKRRTGSQASEIDAEILGRKISYRLEVPGEHLALNSLGALLAAAVAGSDVEACAAALAHYKQTKGRGVIQTIAVTGGEITVIDESFNASPAAVRFAIRVLGEMKPGIGGRRILVLGDMRELGTLAPSLHVDLDTSIIEAGIDRVFCCGEMMKHLYDALPTNGRGYHAMTSAGLAPHIVGAVRAGDIITVKGSHSMHMEVIIEALRMAGETTRQQSKQANG
jgi:UDP-N-acetylmuramoyl-tripeptide--D-alanyl-D-alanine ligase